MVNVGDVLQARRNEHEREKRQLRQKRMIKALVGIGLLGMLASTGLKFVIGLVHAGESKPKPAAAQGVQEAGYILYSATGMTRLTQAEYDAIVKKNGHR